MSLSEFLVLRSEDPVLSLAARRLQGWAKAHPGSNFIDPRRVAREVGTGEIGVEQLLEVLLRLVAAGQLVVVYRVIDPNSGTLVPGEFESPKNVPSRLSNAFEQGFDTSDAEIVPVFRGATD